MTEDEERRNKQIEKDRCRFEALRYKIHKGTRWRDVVDHLIPQEPGLYGFPKGDEIINKDSEKDS
jgi:hypothetical protein